MIQAASTPQPLRAALTRSDETSERRDMQAMGSSAEPVSTDLKKFLAAAQRCHCLTPSLARRFSLKCRSAQCGYLGAKRTKS